MLNRNVAEPLYVQVHNILLDRINTDTYSINTKIPSESELCAEFGVSRMTLRSVITELVRDGRLYRIQGKGTFVSEPKITANTGSYIGIREQLEQQGYEVKTTLLGVENVIPSADVSKILALDVDEKVYIIRRLRYIKNEPLSLHTSYIPVKYCSGLEKQDFCNEQLCKILSQNYGLIRKTVNETLESILATNEESSSLNILKGYPLLLLSDKIYDAEGRLFEYSKVVFRGDKIQINLQYSF